MRVLSCLLLLTASSLLSVASATVFVVATTPWPLPEEDAVAVEARLANLTAEALPDTRRSLRSQQNDRSLLSCSRLCRGFPADSCYLVYRWCYLYRRHMEEISEDVEEDYSELQRRELLSPEEDAECQVKIAQVQEQMEMAVSNETLPIINGTNFICYEECEINGFALWNADCDDQSRPSITDGALICKNDYDFSIEAVVDGCVESVTFQLFGPSGNSRMYRQENSAPFHSFGNSGAEITGASGFGLTLQAGTYTLTATPDDDIAMTQSITFDLVEC